jgi:hypothetical protein
MSVFTGFFSCGDDFENYSLNPGDTLSFSVDTLSFDTVLTTVHSPFRSFLIYNRNKKPLLISSVNLAEGENSNFKINVDGFPGSSLENIEIRANDSLYVLVDVNPKQTGQLTPELFRDYLVFVTNGVEQKLVLEGYGQDVFKWTGMVLTSNAKLSNQKPFLIYDSLVIKEGVTVEIKEGSTFYMHNNAQLIVRGTLKIKGTVEKPVTFRGSRTDNMLYIPYDLIPGQWGGISFDSKSYGNEMENVHIRNGKFGMDFKESEPEKNKITLKNVVVSNVSGTLIQAVNCNITAENCVFSNARNAVLHLTGGVYRFAHCTIANYYPYAPESGWLNSNNETLILANSYYPESETEEPVEPQIFPILTADFSNTIIWGDKSTSGIQIEDHAETFTFYTFRNCLLPNEGENDDIFTNCLFHVNPVFNHINPVENEEKIFYPVYDFSLQEKSPARNVADREIAEQIPSDIKGVSRMADGEPDMGAYEFNNDNQN